MQKVIRLPDESARCMVQRCIEQRIKDAPEPDYDEAWKNQILEEYDNTIRVERAEIASKEEDAIAQQILWDNDITQFLPDDMVSGR